MTDFRMNGDIAEFNLAVGKWRVVFEGFENIGRSVGGNLDACGRVAIEELFGLIELNKIASGKRRT